MQWRDRFVVRSYSPVHVIGGGVVLRAQVRRSTTLKSDDLALLEALRADDEAQAVRVAFTTKTVPVTAADIAHDLALDEASVTTQLDALVNDGEALKIPLKGGRVFYTTAKARDDALAAIDEALRAFHKENPTETGMVKETLRSRAVPKMDEECFEELLGAAAEQGKVLVANGKVSHPEAGAAAVQVERDAVEKLYQALARGGATPPTAAQIIQASGLADSLAWRALGILEKEGRAVKVDSEYYFEGQVVAGCERVVRDRLAAGPAGAAELRDLMGTNRKCAIVLLEYFDSIGLTRREGDERVLR